MLSLALSFVFVLSMVGLTLAQTSTCCSNCSCPAGPPQVVKDMVAKTKAGIKVS